MKSRKSPVAVLCSILLLGCSVPAQNTERNPTPAKGVDLPEIRHFKKATEISVSADSLPAPYATESARKPSRRVDQPADAYLSLPEGFSVSVYADEWMTYPRMMAEAPNGDVFVSDPRVNRIVILRDKDKDGRADESFVFTEDTVQPFGLAFRKGWLYVANTDSVVRFRYESGQTKATGAPEKLLELPGQGYRQHWTRNLAFSPDEKKLYVTVGSESNVEIEPDPRRAAISVYDIDGKNHRVFAGGLRNPVGLAFNPVSGELWTTVNERDRLGDDLVPDYVTSVKDGGFYGWPYLYIGKNIDPRRKDDLKEGMLEKVIVPDVLVTSHSAALGMVFYGGEMFPDEYKGDAFVAFHGSWNREQLTGYKVVRIRFGKDGKPLKNAYEDFLSGWLPDPASNEVWGRPVGLLVLSDGSMLVADDGAAKIWRVTYGKK